MSALLELAVLEVRLLNTGDGLGEKLPLIKSHILPAPPFRPKEFCVDVGVPKRPCSVLTGGTCDWLCIPVRRDWDSDWDSDPSGEAEREEDECREEERAREPGILTGAEPPNNL